MNKRGQVALFVIIAVVIVAIILFFFLAPVKNPFQPTPIQSPNAFLRSCLEQELTPLVTTLASHGGVANPTASLKYQGEDVFYLCYTAEYYKTCVVQEPFIKERFEQEISKAFAPKVATCLSQLQQSYEQKGYTITIANRGSQVLFSPGKMGVTLFTPMTITKDSTQTFKDISFSLDSEYYDLLLTATSIVAFESAYGDAETTLYVQYYPNLKIGKTKLTDGSKVYKLTNVVTNEQFTFASRSLSWPAGYDLA